MAGANYMGGKRNTARVKSRDIVGRAQRRHFGKQRLASALCVAQAKHIHTNVETLLSLPEITLAHARRDAAEPGATSSRVSRNELNLSRSWGNTTQRRKPSKILGALDTSDHVSMRTAIDRILQQPNLVGISNGNFKEITLVEHAQSPTTVAPLKQACLTPKNPDAVCPEIALKWIDTPATPSEIAEYECTGFNDPDRNTRHRSPESGIFSQIDSPSRMHDIPSQSGMDDSGHAEMKMLTGIHAFFCTEGNRFDTFLDSVYPLPRSSPLASESPPSSNLLLDLDTSPSAGILFGRRPEDESADDYMVTRKHRPITRLYPPSPSFSILDGPASVDEAQSTILSFINSDEEKLETERCCATCHDNILAFSSTSNSKSGDSFSSECGPDTLQVAIGHQVNDVPNRIPIDFLSDPHPWETIGRILGLEPPGSSAAHFPTINFTNNREGVGYASRERSGTRNARSPDTVFFNTKLDEDDTRAVSTIDPPVLPYADLEVENTDDRMTVDTVSPCADSSTMPLLNRESPATAYATIDFNTVPVVHCVEKKGTRSAFHPTSNVEATVVEPDMIYAGPCLFGDSDLEEDG